MIKKKLNILLLLSLVALFTSLLGTTCYAKELTYDDIKNFIYNYCIFYGYTEEQSEAFVNNFETLPNANDNSQLEIDRWLNIANNLYPNQWALIGAYNRIIIWRYGGSENNMRTYKPYIYNSSLYVNISYLNVWKTIWTISTDSTLTETYSQGSASQDLTSNNKFFYTDCAIYSTSTNGNIVYSADSSVPAGVFDNNRVSSYFDIDINANFRNNKATISNDTSGTEYYLIPYTIDKIRIGNMFDYSNLDGVVKRKFRYKQSIRDFELVQEFQSDTNNLYYYDIVDDSLIVFEYSQPDTAEFITFIPKEDTGFTQFTVPIYYTSANTNIVGGVIDTGNTFSGDYYNNYNNDTNTQELINNTNDDSQVEAILSDTFSSSGDLFNAFGFIENFDNPFVAFLYTILNGICDSLLDDGNVTLDLNFHGSTQFLVNSDDIYLPNGLLKSLISSALVFGVIYIYYRWAYSIVLSIQTANIEDIKEKLGHDEFYDTDYF